MNSQNEAQALSLWDRLALVSLEVKKLEWRIENVKKDVEKLEKHLHSGYSYFDNGSSSAERY